MDMEAMVRDAYERLGRWDSEALLEFFSDDAKFFVPGGTRVSGDHGRDDIAPTLATMREIASEGFRRDVLAVAPTSAGAMVVVHDYVTRNGEEIGYHSVHDWDVRDGKVAYWWIYVHEYDAFERAWA
jgi:ketosteroid isomerase-like protein